MSRGLVVSQVVMCTLLLMLAGVFLRSLHNLRGQETGYREDRLLVADVAPPRELPEARRDQMIEELRARVAALPGVEVGRLQPRWPDCPAAPLNTGSAFPVAPMVRRMRRLRSNSGSRRAS